MDNFFGNKKQKAVWIIYVVIAIIIFLGNTSYNGSNFACYGNGHCQPILSNIIVVTVIFAVISLIFKSRKKKSDE